MIYWICYTHKKFKATIKYGLVLKIIHRIFKSKQKAWLKSYIDMNTDLREKAKTDFGKYFFKLMNNAVFGKTIENVGKRKDIKLVTAEEETI